MITAKLKCTSKEPVGQPAEDPADQQWMLVFGPDYDDGANAEWALYTPALSLSMTVKASVAEEYAVGQPWDLAFTKPDGHAEDADRDPAADVAVPPGSPVDPELSKIAHEAANPPAEAANPPAKAARKAAE